MHSFRLWVLMLMFKLGQRSLENLAGGSDRIQKVVHSAIKITDVDFSVIQTLRTPEEQAELLASGKSQTSNSLHLPQVDGKAWAVDIYPWVNGRTSHDPDHYMRIAKAMFAAAFINNVPIEWGGFWHQTGAIKAINSDLDDTGWDMPHFQIMRM